MGRLNASISAFLLATALAVGLSACGSGSGADLLPGGTASEIKSNLEQVRQLVDEGDCPGAADAASAVGIQVEELKGVDPKLKTALAEGANRLNEVVGGCEEDEPEETTESFEEEEPEIEENEKPEKPKKEKPEKEKPEKEDKAPEEAPEPPGQEEEKGNEETGGGAPSGGVGPGTAVETE
jgi:outer membrane biosynthesis protein TonB